MNPNEKLTFQELKEIIPKSGRGYADIGLIIFLLFFVLGGIWATTAPLESAVVASGNFVATGANKIVQHLEGGIVEKILVKEGDRIKKGQVLVRLDKTKAEAEYARLYKRKIQLDVYKARLLWELAGKKDKFVYQGGANGLTPVKGTITLPVRRPENFKLIVNASFSEEEDKARQGKSKKALPPPPFSQTEVNKIIRSQQNEFSAGLDSRRNQILRLHKQVSAETKKIAGLRSVASALGRRKSEIDQQISKKKSLLKRGLTTRRDLDSLILTRTQDRATFQENKSLLEQSKVRILELREAIKGVNLLNREEKSKELRAASAELSDIEQRLVQAQDISNRVFIRAPVEGVIVQLSLNTEGGVITPGQQLAEILPTQNTLQIQAQVSPTDIDDVEVGQKAMVQLSALNQRTTPMVRGEVTYVSADLIQPDKEKVGSYIVRVNLTKEDLQEAKKRKAVPGMPVSVFIQTGSQTYWQYLTRPIIDSFQKAAREK